MKPNGFVFAASITSQMSIPMARVNDLQLVDQRDIHAAENILQQLGRFGDPARGDRHNRVDRLAIKRHRPLQTRRGIAADHFGNARTLLCSLPGSSRSGEKAR